MQSIAHSEGSTCKYCFDKFCTDHNLYQGGKEEKAGGIWIVCPFHKDEQPSLSFNEDRWIWHCFGCGLGGNWTKFAFLYETEVEGKRIKYANFLNNLLLSDNYLRVLAGFNSIFDDEAVRIEDFKPLTRPRFKIDYSRPETYIELQEKFLKTNRSIQEIELFILLMQQGVGTDHMRKTFNMAERPNSTTEDLEPVKEKKQYDLTALWADS